jgi:BolA protein
MWPTSAAWQLPLGLKGETADMSVMQLQERRADRIAAALRAEFAPLDLVVLDESARHHGHAGAAAGGQTHYHVKLVSERFIGMNRVQRARCVNEALEGEFSTGLHALSLTLRAPGEAVLE